MRKKRNRGWIINLVCVLMVLCMFSIASLMLISVGVGVYKNITVSNLENFKLRTSLSFVAAKVRQADCENNVYLEHEKDTDMLVMDSMVDDVVYETRIYFHDGKLYELYQEKGCEYSLNGGQEIAEIKDFNIEQVKDGLFRLTVKNNNQETQSLLLCSRANN